MVCMWVSMSEYLHGSLVRPTLEYPAPIRTSRSWCLLSFAGGVLEGSDDGHTALCENPSSQHCECEVGMCVVKICLVGCLIV